MICVPRQFRPLLNELSAATKHRDTAHRLVLFFACLILLSGKRTVSSVVRLLTLLTPVNPSTYHRLFSHRCWRADRFARIIARSVIEHFCPDGVIRIVGDETVDGHRGKRVYGKARHRDAVRSTHSHTVYRYGHKWVVLAVLVELPGVGRPLALPLLVALYRDQKTNLAERRRHKTQAELMCGLLVILMRWFPERKFVFAGDNAYGTHQMCRFAHRHRRQLALVSKFIADANLYVRPPKRRPGTNGRPRVKGRALPKPCEVVQQKRRGKKLHVRWYGGGWRNVEVFAGTGHWFKSGKGLVEVRWVMVRDLDGTHRDEYLFSTDVTMSIKRIIEMYGGRWNIETTFQELREHLGLETTRGWHRNTVLRMAPSLFLIYTVVVVFFETLPVGSGHRRSKSWVGKSTITFSDMITSVRCYLWYEWVFEQTPDSMAVRKLPQPIKRLINYGLMLSA